MDSQDYGTADVPYYIACLRDQGDLLADAAGQAGLDAPVPSCPGWLVRDLLGHVGFVHRWAAGHVTGRGDGRPARLSEQELIALSPADELLPGWFRQGHAALVSALQDAPPELDCWTFLPAPSPLAFWARRQAHETAIHHADAQLAAGRQADGLPAGFFPARLAADGVDELLMGFARRSAGRGQLGIAPGVIAFHAADGGGDSAHDSGGDSGDNADGGTGAAHWLVSTAAGQPEVSRGRGPADCDVTGPASDLYLTLWNRPARGDLEVRGDPALLAAFRQELRITWS
jgi:uncharacterized protein (TIGR03083 family)